METPGQRYFIILFWYILAERLTIFLLNNNNNNNNCLNKARLRSLLCYMTSVLCAHISGSCAAAAPNMLRCQNIFCSAVICTSQQNAVQPKAGLFTHINPLNAELNPICCLLALLGAHHFLHVSMIRVKSLTLRLLMSYIYIWH
jgi:hypothetical protein